MHILFLNNMLINGGAEVSLCRIANLLAGQGHDVTVITLAQEKEPYKVLSSTVSYDYILFNSCSYNRIKRLWLRGCNFVRKHIMKEILRKKINRSHADAAITFNEFERCLLPLAKSRIPQKICWLRHDITDYHLCRRILLEDRAQFLTLFSAMDKLLFVTGSSMRNFQEAMPELATPCAYILNSIDTEAIQLRAKLSTVSRPANKIVFICVARLSFEKGQDLLYDAVEFLDRSELRDAYEIWLVGDYTDSGYQINPKNIQSDNIKLLGRMDNPYPYMKAADVLICASRTEGCPNVLVEAMALGKPIISTRTSGGIELLENGRYGLLCDIDGQSVAAAMATMQDPEERRTFAALSAAHSEHFRNETFLARLNSTLGIPES